MIAYGLPRPSKTGDECNWFSILNAVCQYLLEYWGWEGNIWGWHSCKEGLGMRVYVGTIDKETEWTEVKEKEKLVLLWT